MFDPKLILTGGALCVLGLAACDVDDKDSPAEDAGCLAGDAVVDPDCDDAGNCECPDGAGGAGGSDGQGGAGGDDGPVVKDTYVYVIIRDTTRAENINAKGSPGVDICGIQVNCPAGGPSGSAIAASLDPGQGEVCMAGGRVGGESCSADRGDETAAVGAPEAMCSVAPVGGKSQYVAIGRAGELSLQVDPDVFETGLKGCSIDVVELAGGAEPESYTVHVCADEEGTDCHPCADPILADGDEGRQTFQVPATCEE